MLSEKEKFANRLNQLLDEKQYSIDFEVRQLALANALQIDPDVISIWLKGEDFPRTSELVKLSQLLNVRSNWLLLGVGSKLDVNHDNVQNFQIREATHEQTMRPNLSKDAYELAYDWMKLPQQQRNALAALIKSLVVQPSESVAEQYNENP